MTPEIKQQIDGLSRIEMAYLWRFGSSENEMLQGEAGKYFAKRFEELGGFSPEISKMIGW